MKLYFSRNVPTIFWFTYYIGIKLYLTSSAFYYLQHPLLGSFSPSKLLLCFLFFKCEEFHQRFLKFVRFGGIDLLLCCSHLSYVSFLCHDFCFYHNFFSAYFLWVYSVISPTEIRGLFHFFQLLSLYISYYVSF